MPMADDDAKTTSSEGEDYEILPQKEIQELKEELRKLKEFEIMPSKKMQVSLVELNTKLDKLLNIFEEATTALHIEEGGMSFKEKISPIIEKMNKVLDQNAEIAQGIVAVADLVKELREDIGKSKGPEMPQPFLQSESFGQLQPAQGAQPMMPPPALPPPPPRRRRFGL
jgi:hypothetical protein